jgi:hypothetical protein
MTTEQKVKMIFPEAIDSFGNSGTYRFMVVDNSDYSLLGFSKISKQAAWEDAWKLIQQITLQTLER